MFAVPANTIALPPRMDRRNLVRLAREFVADRNRWINSLKYDPDRRWKELVAKTSDLEMWLASWLPGQGEEMHDHNNLSGAFVVASGVLTERVLQTQGGQPREMTHELVTGQIRVFGPSYVHHIVNKGQIPAVSVHVYLLT